MSPFYIQAIVTDKADRAIIALNMLVSDIYNGSPAGVGETFIVAAISRFVLRQLSKLPVMLIR